MFNKKCKVCGENFEMLTESENVEYCSQECMLEDQIDFDSLDLEDVVNDPEFVEFKDSLHYSYEPVAQHKRITQEDIRTYKGY